MKMSTTSPDLKSVVLESPLIQALAAHLAAQPCFRKRAPDSISQQGKG